MLLYLIIYAVICVFGMKIAVKPAKGTIEGKTALSFILDRENTWFDYLSREKTEAIKGIFAIMVFFSHFCNCFDFNVPSDMLVKRIIGKFFGQLMVAMFMFYSGYGIMESYRKKGRAYAVNMPVQRILKLFIDFNIAIAAFLIMNACFGKFYSIKHIIFTMFAWRNVGNSDWYIFAILAMYVLSFLSFIIAKKNHTLSAVLLTVFSMIYIVVMSRFKQHWWYDTVLCYVLGTWYSLFREKIESIVQKSNVTWAASAVVLTAGFFVTRYLRSFNSHFFEVQALIFTMLIVVISMKISFDNALLRKLGKNVFGIYVLQKIPVIFMYRTGLITMDYVYLKFIIILAVTVILTFGYNRILKLTSKLVKKAEIKI